MASLVGAMPGWKIAVMCAAVVLAALLARLPVEAVIGLGRHVSCGPAVRAAFGHAPPVNDPGGEGSAAILHIDGPQEQADRGCSSAGRERLLLGVAIVAIAVGGVWISERR